MKAVIYKPPVLFDYSNGRLSVFLAGSIEMGAAEDWQEIISKKLSEFPVAILNPRRDDWDSSWAQSIENDQFRKQVVWELAAQDYCDIILMYFSPGTKSPITLLELGLFARTGKLVVCCPEGFWRKGNIDIVCSRYNIKQTDSLDDLVKVVEHKLNGECNVPKVTAGGSVVASNDAGAIGVLG